MTDYFAEKAHQVEPNGMSSFGIGISSRYGKAQELIEMIRFTSLAAQAGVAHYVKEVFYDSKACCCSFTLAESVREHDLVAKQIQEAARASISQFDWFGYVDHGGDEG